VRPQLPGFAGYEGPDMRVLRSEGADKGTQVTAEVEGIQKLGDSARQYVSGRIAKAPHLERVRPINGRMLRNHKLAGQLYPIEKLPIEVKQTHPHSVPFNGSGHPDFSRYAIKKVQVEMTGVRGVDDSLANSAAAITAKPSGYTWHHHEDAKTMMLVSEKIHDAVKHTGGVSVLKAQSHQTGGGDATKPRP
jgi:hypothetical protein